MKLFNLLCTLALATAVITSGCGGSDTSTPTNGVVGAPANVTAPVGCYNNGYTSCSPCPAGYVQSGGGCVPSGSAVSNCPVGTTWANNACVPNGFNGSCPTTNGQYSPTSGYCSGYTNNYSNNYFGNNWYCPSVTRDPSSGLYLYTCYYVQNAPTSYSQGGFCYATYWGWRCQ